MMKMLKIFFALLLVILVVFPLSIVSNAIGSFEPLLRGDCYPSYSGNIESNQSVNQLKEKMPNDVPVKNSQSTSNTEKSYIQKNYPETGNGSPEAQKPSGNQKPIYASVGYVPEYARTQDLSEDANSQNASYDYSDSDFASNVGEDIGSQTAPEEIANTDVVKYPEDSGYGLEIQSAQMRDESPTPYGLVAATSKEANELYKFLKETEGKKIISGQQEGNQYYQVENEIKYIQDLTTKTPAIRGFDLMRYFQNWGKGYNDGTVERAIDWFNNKGGIVTISWHWPVPGGADDSFYARNASFDVWKAVYDSNSWEYKAIDSDINKAAGYLERLKNAGVPVLWRPLHEADDPYFWWGKDQNPQMVKTLYIRMFENFKQRGLNNLIWVWTNANPDYYPGDQYVDVVGADAYWMYNKGDSMLSKVKSYANGRKLKAITENDILPNSSVFPEWSWFMAWDGNAGIYTNSQDSIKKTYFDPKVVTLGDLPKWR